MTLVNAQHITASVFVNDDESGLHHDYEVWLERLAPHAPIDQAGPEVGCTTASAKLASSMPLSRGNRGNNADAHLKRAAQTGCTSQIMGRDAQRWWR
jgi:thiamine phosphate synthase YjbQ (UPF0047 family)